MATRIRRLETVQTFTRSTTSGNWTQAVTIPSGTDRMVIITVGVSGGVDLGGTLQLNGVTLNGTSPTEQLYLNVDASGGSNYNGAAYVGAWKEADIASGNVVVDLGSSTNLDAQTLAVFTYENVDQTQTFANGFSVGKSAGAADPAAFTVTEAGHPAYNAIVQGIVWTGSTNLGGWLNSNSPTPPELFDIVNTAGLDNHQSAVDSTDAATGADDSTLPTYYDNGDWVVNPFFSFNTSRWHWILEVDAPAPTYPAVEATATSTNTGAAGAVTYNVTMPAHTAGDMLLLLLSAKNSVGTTASKIPSDWRIANTTTNFANHTYHIVWKIAETSSETLSLPNMSDAGCIAYAISGANKVESWASEYAFANPANPDPLNYDRGIDADYLWIAAFDAESQNSVASAAPSGYSNLITLASARNDFGGGQSAAQKTRSAASENPGAFTLGLESIYSTHTIAVWKDDSPIEALITGEHANKWTNHPTNTGTVDIVHTSSNTNDNGQRGYVVRAWSLAAFPVREDGYIQFNGTYEDLGISAGSTINGYDACSFRWFIDGYSNLSEGYIGDNDGTGAALELIEDPNGSPTSRVLISNLADPSGNTSLATASNNPNITGLSISASTEIAIRVHFTASAITPSPTFNAYVGSIRIGIDYTEPVPPIEIASTTSATSTVAGALDRNPTFASTIAATTTVTGNIDETLRLVSATASTSVVSPTLAVTRTIVSTTSAASFVTPSLAGFARLASTIAATSTVTGNIDETRKLLGTTAVTSVVGPTPTLDVSRDMITTVSANSLLTTVVELSKELQSTVSASSTISGSVRSITPVLSSTTNVTATVTGNIDETLKLVSATSVTSVLGPAPSLAVTRILIAPVTVSSLVSGNLPGRIQFESTITVTSDVSAVQFNRVLNSLTTPIAQTATITASFEVIQSLSATIGATSSVSAKVLNGRPSIAAKTTYQSPGTGTQFTIPLPTHRAGQMLAVFIAHGDNNSPAWDTVGSTANWRCERQGGNFAGTDVGGAWYFKLAESNSEVLVAENFSFEKFHAIAYAIDDADQYFIRSHNQGLFGSTQNPEFRPITFDKARTNLLSFTAVYGEADSIMTAAPTGYTIDETLQGGAGFNDGSVSVATKEIASASSEAPSTATMLNNAAHCSTTFVVYKRGPNETTFQKRWGFNDSTSYFDNTSSPPRYIDNDWLVDSAGTNGGFGPFISTNQDGPSGSDWFDDAFWCVLHSWRDNDLDRPDPGYIENVTTFEQLGLNAGDAILGFDVSSIWYEHNQVDSAGGVQARTGSATNGTVEIITPYETVELIPATAFTNSIAPWTQITGSAVNLTTPILATDSVSIRIYSDATGDEITQPHHVKFEDFELNALVETNIDGVRTFRTTVAATSTVSADRHQKRMATAISATSSAIAFLYDDRISGSTVIVYTANQGVNRVWIDTDVAWGTDIDTFFVGTSPVKPAGAEWLFITNYTTSAPTKIYLGGTGGDFVLSGGTYAGSVSGAVAYGQGVLIPASSLSTATRVQVETNNEGGQVAWIWLANVDPSSPVITSTVSGSSATLSSGSVYPTDFVAAVAQARSTNASFPYVYPSFVGTNMAQDNDYQFFDGDPPDLGRFTTWSTKFQEFTPGDNFTITGTSGSGSTSFVTSIVAFAAADRYNTALAAKVFATSTVSSPDFNNFFEAQATVTATATLTDALIVDRPLVSTTTATTLVTGNIDETRKLIGSSVAQSAVVLPTNLDVIRGLVSTTTATALVSPNVGLTVFFDSQTDAVTTVNPNQFYYGFEGDVTATSTVTADLNIDRFMLSTTVAQSAVVGPTNIERTVNWDSTTSVASAVFVNYPLVDRPLRADFNGFSVTEGNMRLSGKMASVITVTSAVDPTELERVRGYESTTNITSDVGGNIVQGLRFLTGVIAQSAVVLPTNLEVARDMIAPITATSLVTPALERQVDWQTALAVNSTVIGTVVVITNTLELTFFETYLYEPEPCVLRFKTDTFDSTVTVNEILPPVELQDDDVLDPMIIDSDHDC